MVQALIIIFSLVFGYFCNFKILSNTIISKMLAILIGFVIFFMGYIFGFSISQISYENFISIINVVIIFTILMFFFNIVFAELYFFFFSKYAITPSSNKEAEKTNTSPVLQSLKYFIYLVVGFMIGFFMEKSIDFLTLLINFMIIIILFVVGIQIRREGHSLLGVFKNGTGIAVSIALIISSFLVAFLITWIFSIPLQTSLMMSSGFGWYSLSSIVNTQLLGVYYGTITFFVDFFREIIAIMIIPILSKKLPNGLISYSGATSIDFTLPIIRKNIGLVAVPAAISSGFISTITTPFFIYFFNLFN